MDFSTKNKNINISLVDIFIFINDDVSNMKEICSTTNKSFLPVINKPIIFYQLEFLERNNIKEVNILVIQEELEKTQSFVSLYKGSLKFNFIGLDTDYTEILSAIKKKVTKNNFLLLEGDTILSFDLGELIENHIDNKNLLTLILQKKEEELSKLKHLREETLDAFGIDFNDNNRVVYYHKKKNEENLVINKKIFKRFSNFNLIMNYIDIGFYIFNSSVFDLFDNINSKIENEKKEEKKNKLKPIIKNIKDGFVPYLIKKTFSKELNMILIEKYNNDLLKSNRIKIGSKLVDNSQKNLNEFCYKIYDFPSYLLTIEEIQKSYDEIKPIFFQTKNNIKNYFLNFAEKIRENLENNKKFSNGIIELEGISADSYISDEIRNIGKKIVISKSVVEKGLSLEDGGKIISCLVGPNTKIGKDSKLTNCIIGKSCEIGDNCNISDCIIADNYKIKEKTNASQKILSPENENLNFN